MPSEDGQGDPGKRAPPAGGARASPVFAVVAVALFLLAMAFPALGSCLDSGSAGVDWIRNRDIVLGGPLGPLVFEFGWYANVPFVFAVIALLMRRRVPIWLVVIQAALVLSSLLPVPLLGAAEAPAHLCRWGAGYWIWFSAQTIILVGGVASGGLSDLPAEGVGPGDGP